MTSAAERVRADVGVESLEVRAYRIPTDGPDGTESDGTQPEEGVVLRPDRSRPGHGLGLKREDAAQWLVYGGNA